MDVAVYFEKIVAGFTCYHKHTLGVGGALGCLYTGSAWDNFGASGTFTIAAGCALLGLILLLWKLPRVKPKV